MANHWQEYVSEAAALGLFMVAATAAATALQHPLSPLSGLLADPLRRVPMGAAMGLTAMTLIYSPLGRRSGAHMNPAVTLTFWRLGKMGTADAFGYIAGQFAGGMIGILAAAALLHGLPADPSVNYVATTPGTAGSAAAFAAEAVISFGMMLLVLWMSNHPRLAPLTGGAAGTLVALYIVFEAPLSGMSMNPARTLGPALLSHTTRLLWIYVLAPPLGMLAAAELFLHTHGRERVGCAKLHHTSTHRCIFECRHRHATPAEIPA